MSKADRFRTAARLAEAEEHRDEIRGRGLRRLAQLHFQDTFFVGVMTWAVAEQKSGKLSELSADLVSQWNRLSLEQMDRGYSIYSERRW